MDLFVFRWIMLLLFEVYCGCILYGYRQYHYNPSPKIPGNIATVFVSFVKNLRKSRSNIASSVSMSKCNSNLLCNKMLLKLMSNYSSGQDKIYTSFICRTTTSTE